MRFVYSRWNPETVEENTYYLEDRNWNDYGYYTTFYLYYCDENKDLKFMGEVKILNIDNGDTAEILKNYGEFKELDENFISLGQSREYYENLGGLSSEKKVDLLKSLRDYSIIDSEKKLIYRGLEGFDKSLLREWSASYLLENSKEIMANSGHIVNQKKYIYSTKLEGAEKEHEIDFDFIPKDFLPYRNFILIGKNGVGKTKVLENLVWDILEENSNSFKDSIPKYKKILLFYYGSDLEYEKLKGIENEKLKKIDIKSDFDYSKELETIKNKKREEYFKRLLVDLLGREQISNSLIPNEQLSSGQKVIYKLLIKILANIEEETLIVIDEPETHLHPNIIGRLMIFIRGILEDFISHSIMSTHSPIILQQTLSRSVRLVERENNYPVISKLNMECFGENLTKITEEIFNVADFEDDYKLVLKKLKSKKRSDKEILALFDGKLGFNANIYLASLSNDEEDYQEKKDEKIYND